MDYLQQQEHCGRIPQGRHYCTGFSVRYRVKSTILLLQNLSHTNFKYLVHKNVGVLLKGFVFKPENKQGTTPKNKYTVWPVVSPTRPRVPIDERGLNFLTP